MNLSLKLLDVVALVEDLPELGLHRGQVGTIVEVYEPGAVEVEFSNMQGQTYALETLGEKLHHHPFAEAAPSYKSFNDYEK
jgi:Domain of unknown function (DUF4926)